MKNQHFILTTLPAFVDDVKGTTTNREEYPARIGNTHEELRNFLNRRKQLEGVCIELRPIIVSFIKEKFESSGWYYELGEQNTYRKLDQHFPHGMVHHSRDEYVCGAVHTNTIEGFWSIVKRGIVGTFHKVSAKYLPLYVNEFEIRYNNRMNSDIFGAAIRAC